MFGERCRAAGVAGVPVADYLAAYADEMEPLRAFDRGLFVLSEPPMPRCGTPGTASRRV